MRSRLHFKRPGDMSARQQTGHGEVKSGGIEEDRHLHVP